MVKKHINNPSQNTINILRGISCSNCLYQLKEVKVINRDGSYKFLKTSRGDVFGYYELISPHCAMRTTLSGCCSDNSLLINDFACNNHVMKNKINKVKNQK